MIAVIAKVTLKEGQKEAFEKVFTAFRKTVMANETDTAMYDLFCARDNELTYHIVEKYKDDEAFQEHFNAAHTQEFLALAEEHGFPMATYEIVDQVES